MDRTLSQLAAIIDGPASIIEGFAEFEIFGRGPDREDDDMAKPGPKELALQAMRANTRTTISPAARKATAKQLAADIAAKSQEPTVKKTAKKASKKPAAKSKSISAKKATAKKTKTPAKAKAKAAKPTVPKKAKAIAQAINPGAAGERNRYDWKAAQAMAAAGTVPAGPDFSAPTHARFLPIHEAIKTAARAGDAKALAEIEINPISSTPKAMARYRDLCVQAINAKAATKAA